jgi:uncharacterized RDD family membrane protein YckC
MPDEAVACPNCGQPRTPTATGPPVQAPDTTLVYADFWSRFGGAFIDWLVLILPSLMFRGAFLVGGIAIGFLYHWLLVAYWDGQTVGKRVVGVRVTRPNGDPVDPAVAAARALMRIVSGLAFGIGFLWAAWDPEKRTWHDMAADTRVFRVR